MSLSGAWASFSDRLLRSPQVSMGSNSQRAPSPPPRPIPPHSHFFNRADSSSMGSRRAYGLDVIDHAEQIRLLATILGHDGDHDDDHDGVAAPFYGQKAFDSSWSASSDVRSWGMPPTGEERGQEAARRRRESETRLALHGSYVYGYGRSLYHQCHGSCASTKYGLLSSRL